MEADDLGQRHDLAHAERAGRGRVSPSRARGGQRYLVTGQLST